MRHEGIDRLVEVSERRAWMAQQGKLDGAAEPIGVAASLSHLVSVQPAQVNIRTTIWETRRPAIWDTPTSPPATGTSRGRPCD